MASPGELVAAVAAVLGVPQPSVVVHDRNLVVAGLRTKGGRGRSAARVTARDAAGLLIAVAGSSLVRDSVETWNDYAPLHPTGGQVQRPVDGGSDINHSPPPVWDLGGLPICSLQALPESHTFGDALAALISAAADGSLASALEEAQRKTVENGGKHFTWGIQVDLFAPANVAIIRIFAGGSRFKTEETKRYGERNTPRTREELASDSTGDLTQQRSFRERTIVRIGQLLKA